MSGAATLVAVGTALPQASMTQEDLWETYFRDYYADNPIARRVWRNSGVGRRYGVVDPIGEGVPSWGTGARMRRFVDEAVPLGRAAVEACLARAGIAPRDVGLFAVVSCTGYATPGLDILLARDLGMDGSVERLHVGHMGCYAAIPGLAAAADAVAARGKTAVLLCVELTTLHVQPPSGEVDQIVAHALFSDAAAAAAFAPDGSGLDVLGVVARTDVARAPLMTWDVTDLGFRMGLSPEVPDVLEAQIGAAVRDLVAPHGLDVRDVAFWAVHPGGPRIVEAAATGLGLDPAVLRHSRDVLHEYGNCSSATVLLVLDRILAAERPNPGDHGVLVAFGPGLTLYAALVRARGS